MLLSKTQRSYISLLHFLDKIDGTYFLVYFKEAKYTLPIINIFLNKFKLVIVDLLVRNEGIKECDIPALIQLYESSVDNYVSVATLVAECIQYVGLILGVMCHFECLTRQILLHEELLSLSYVSDHFEDSYVVEVPNKSGILFSDLKKTEGFINSVLIEYFHLYDRRNVVFSNYNNIHLIYERIY